MPRRRFSSAGYLRRSRRRLRRLDAITPRCHMPDYAATFTLLLAAITPAFTLLIC